MYVLPFFNYLFTLLALKYFFFVTMQLMMITRSFQSRPQRMIGRDSNVIGQTMDTGWGIILTSLISPIKEDSTRDGGTGRIAGTSMNLYDKLYYG